MCDSLCDGGIQDDHGQVLHELRGGDDPRVRGRQQGGGHDPAQSDGPVRSGE